MLPPATDGPQATGGARPAGLRATGRPAARVPAAALVPAARLRAARLRAAGVRASRRLPAARCGRLDAATEARPPAASPDGLRHPPLGALPHAPTQSRRDLRQRARGAARHGDRDGGRRGALPRGDAVPPRGRDDRRRRCPALRRGRRLPAPHARPGGTVGRRRRIPPGRHGGRRGDRHRGRPARVRRALEARREADLAADRMDPPRRGRTRRGVRRGLRRRPARRHRRLLALRHPDRRRRGPVPRSRPARRSASGSA